jgi:hypothetical protein
VRQAGRPIAEASVRLSHPLRVAAPMLAHSGGSVPAS